MNDLERLIDAAIHRAQNDPPIPFTRQALAALIAADLLKQYEVIRRA